MLSFDRSSLQTKAVRVDGKLAPDDPVWLNGDPRPASDLVVTGRLSSAGEGRFYFSGHMSGEVDAECRRCLTAVRVRVSEELHLLFADAGDEESDESDFYQMEPRASMIDLRAAVREQWILAIPGFSLCREDCKGLCPRCGANLNDGPCACEPETDSRWAALRQNAGDT